MKKIDLKDGKPQKQGVSVYLPLELIAELKKEAQERNLAVSTYIGVILRNYIDGERQDGVASGPESF